MSYIPPHRRNKQQSEVRNQPESNQINHSLPKLLSIKCQQRCQEWMVPAISTSHCPHHIYLLNPITEAITAFYAGKSPKFMRWFTLKRIPTENIAKIFYKKLHYKKERKRDKDVDIASLYNRFLRYAADIDNCVHFTALANDKNKEFIFLDIGFAPGGMSRLLLDKGEHVKGVGISLEPDVGGNIYIPLSTSHPMNFTTVISDIIIFAQSPIPPSFTSVFDLGIIGITTSGSDQKKDAVIDELDLKQLLYFSQLLVCFKGIKKGGALLVRIHATVRLFDLHFLCCLFESFDNENVNVGKPLTEFAMRKTFWCLLTGFNPSKAEKFIKRLEKLVLATPSPYTVLDNVHSSSSGDQQGLSDQLLITDDLETVWKNHGDKIIEVFETIWEAQAGVLQGIVDGNWCSCNRKFRYKEEGGRLRCEFCRMNIPENIGTALLRVDERLGQCSEDLTL